MNRTRTVLLWYNNGAERLTLPVNPARINLRRTQNTRELCTIDGTPLHVACGPGLTHISFSTFLPSEHSRFYTGIPPAHALEMLCRWQNGRRPVRLMISGTDVNDSFLPPRFPVCWRKATRISASRWNCANTGSHLYRAER